MAAMEDDSASKIYLRPIPLMAVRANMMLRFPSMLVLSTRKMCWKLAGITRDILNKI